MIITLDDFFRRPPDDVPQIRQIVSLAAEIGTDRGENPDSVWSDIDYGGNVKEISSVPGATLALSAEFQRIADRHAVGGDVVVTQDATAIGARITITPEGLDLASAIA